jgi:hypothetical protein
MARFFRDSGLPSRRSREAARQRRRSDRASDLKLESLEPRLALASVAGLPDTTPPEARSVSLPAAGTYGTGSNLTFKVKFNEPVKVVGNQSDVFLPIEVGYAMRSAQYVSGSGTRSLTFRMNVKANDVDTDGISLGRVNSAAVRDFDFAANQIQDRAGNPASDVIPAVNTRRIRVDATGPVVAASSGLVVQNGRVSLQVTFDSPVFVTGRPTVPVSIGTLETELRYVGGSGTSKLRFTVPMRQSDVGAPTFRKLVGEVIYLPQGANLKDRLGNAVTPIGGDFGEVYRDKSGNRVVVIGAHYERLKHRTTKSESDLVLTKAMLDGVLTTERDIFSPGASEAYWRDYQNPDYRSALHDVDVYRLAYRTTIPEQGNRPTVAYGLVAIPRGVSGQIPVVSYQHGSLWLKESAPSQAFSWDVTSTAVVNYGLTEQELCLSAYETRLNVAQFAGQGYAVVAADYIGIGNSVENDAFFVKQSGQQACLDMLAASQRLLGNLNLTTSDLFLNGWSQGGIATVAFQEALEARGVRISGVSTSSAGPDMNLFVTQSIFNRRPYSTVTVPDAPWRVFVPQFSAFSLGGYHGQVNTPLELLGGNYEVSRKFYMREFKSPPSFAWQIDVRGEVVPVFIQDGVTTTAEVSRFIDQKAARDPQAYEQTAYARLLGDAGSGKTRLVSDMRMYYGDQDEAGPEVVATSIATWQRGTFGKTNIEMVKVPYASHRSTALTAVAGQIEWFNAKRGLPNAVADLTATLINGGAGATLSWTSPATNGSPITGYRVEYKAVTDTTWNRQADPVSHGSLSATVTGLTPGQRYQYRVFAFMGNGTAGQMGLSSNIAITGNSSPTATPVVTTPNPITGEVTGLLTSVDSNNDPLKYRVSSWPTKGSVTWTFVTVEEVVDTTRMFFTYTPTAAARQAAAAPGATPSDKTDTFTVVVSDGFGGSVSVAIDVVIAAADGIWTTISQDIPGEILSGSFTKLELKFTPYYLADNRVLVVIGLTNGVTYTFRVTAQNA